MSFTSHGHQSRYVSNSGLYHTRLEAAPLFGLQNTLEHPDERQLARGIKATDVPAHLQSVVDALVWESTRTEEGYVAAWICVVLN